MNLYGLMDGFPVFFCSFLFFVCGYDDFSSSVSYDRVEQK